MFFSAEIVASPQAEALLNLYRAELEGEVLTAATLADRMELPIKMMQRWLAALLQQRLIDENAGFDVTLRISRRAEETIERMLLHLARISS